MSASAQRRNQPQSMLSKCQKARVSRLALHSHTCIIHLVPVTLRYVQRIASLGMSNTKEHVVPDIVLAQVGIPLEIFIVHAHHEAAIESRCNKTRSAQAIQAEIAHVYVLYTGVPQPYVCERPSAHTDMLSRNELLRHRSS